jgi:hypothetical protein
MKTIICDCCGERIKEEIVLPKPFVIELRLNGPQPQGNERILVELNIEGYHLLQLDICTMCIVKELKHQLGVWIECNIRL